MIGINGLFVFILQLKGFSSLSTTLYCSNRCVSSFFFFLDHYILCIQLTFSPFSLCDSFSFFPLPETRGPAERNAADGYTDRSGIGDEVPHRNGLRPQTAGRAQGEVAGGRR